MIEINNLNFFYGNNQVLHEINLILEKNTITGLIGSNGAGKSTLMRCIAGLEYIRTGQIRLEGLPLLDNPSESYKKIGYLPDIFSFTDRLTVMQNWVHAAISRGVSKQDLSARIGETAQLLNLEDKLFREVKKLSRGQKQRAAIGQVILNRPQLLILDEPASGLDPEARYELSQLLKLLQQQGMTILVSSHILSELDEYCTHMLVIQEGRIRRHQAIRNFTNNDFMLDEQQNIVLLLRFAHLDAEDHQIIEAAPHIFKVKFDVNDVTVTISHQIQHRVELIQYLVTKQLALIGVEPLKESLLQSYRNSLITAEL